MYFIDMTKLASE